MLKQIESTASDESRSLWMDAAVFVLLVALGAAGRHWMLDWPNFTPMAAISVFAGFYFRRLAVALLVPLAAMAIANVWLPTYNSILMGAVCYAAFFLPVLLPRWMRNLPQVAQATAYGLVPAVTFFIASNFAEWAAGSMYPRNFAGLVECYTLAIPFFRTMVAGDLVYLAVAFGTYATVQAVTARHARNAAVAG